MKKQSDGISLGFGILLCILFYIIATVAAMYFTCELKAEKSNWEQHQNLKPSTND